MIRASADAWQEDGLETLGRCPVCRSTTRTLMFEGLTDQCFFVAPGEWTMWRCADCETAYLDPRPDERTIGLAYAEYYTHGDDSEAEAAAPAGRLAKFKQALGNGYRNRRFGTQLAPSSALGPVAAALRPVPRMAIDADFRFLPTPTGRQRRVLDIGCGDGSWLDRARAAGWDAAGVEPDPAARVRAAERGMDVRERLADWDEAASFDFITLNHVIEHLHAPQEVLRQCFDLLRPGGMLHIETPNAKSFGLQLYGRNWRGLEPPRHLMLFTRSSLRLVVANAGFIRPRFHRRPYILLYLSQASARIAAGLRLDTPEPFTHRKPTIAQRARAFLSLEHGELLVLTCRRPA